MKKVLLMVALAAGMTGFTQQLNFQKGQKLEVVTQIKKASSMELMGQAMDTKVDASLTEIFDIQDASGNAATIEHKVKRLLFNTESVQGPQSFDSEKVGDRDGQIGKMLEKALKNKYTMSLDGAGKITAIKLDDDNPKGPPEADAMIGMLSMQTGINLATPKAGDVTELKILPGKTVKQGDTWTDSSSAEGQKTMIAYTVKTVSGNEITLDFTKEQNIATTQNIMGADATIKGTNKGTGTAVVDKKTGVLKSKTETIESAINVEAQGMSIPVKEKSTRTVTVKAA